MFVWANSRASGVLSAVLRDWAMVLQQPVRSSRAVLHHPPSSEHRTEHDRVAPQRKLQILGPQMLQDRRPQRIRSRGGRREKAHDGSVTVHILR